MIDLITNITDAPGANTVQVDVYNKTLAPGAELRVPADLVDSKLRTLEKSGLIAIGSLPSWYTAAKKRKSRALTEDEMKARRVKPEIKVPPKKKETKDKALTPALPVEVVTELKINRG